MQIITYNGAPATRETIIEAANKDFPALCLEIDPADGRTFIVATEARDAIEACCQLTGGYTWAERVTGIDVAPIKAGA